jgi:hypothetical protein
MVLFMDLDDAVDLVSNGKRPTRSAEQGQWSPWELPALNAESDEIRFENSKLEKGVSGTFPSRDAMI